MIRRVLSEPPQYRRAPRGSVVDAVEPRIRELLQAWPDMPATVIAERTRLDSLGQGAARSGRRAAPGLSASRSRVAHELCGGRGRAVWLLVPRHHAAGRVRPDPHRDQVAGAGDGLRLLPLAVGGADSVRSAEDLFAGWWQLLTRLDAVPRMLVWDGEAAVGRRRGKVSVLTRDTHAFRGRSGRRCTSARRPTRKRKGWWSARTATSRRRSCRDAASPPRSTSTPSWLVGSRWPTVGSSGSWDAPRPRGSTRIGRRCWPCPRLLQRRVGGLRCGCRAITTSGSIPTTTRCIPR